MIRIRRPGLPQFLILGRIFLSTACIVYRHSTLFYTLSLIISRLRIPESGSVDDYVSCSCEVPSTCKFTTLTSPAIVSPLYIEVSAIVVAMFSGSSSTWGSSLGNVENGINEQDQQAVVSILDGLMNIDNAVRNGAETVLAQSVSKRGFLPLLLHIALESETPALQQAAIITLKNLVRSSWSQIAAADRELVRNGLVSSLARQEISAGDHLCMCIAYIAAEEFPVVWPDVVVSLLGLLQAPSSIEKINASTALRYVVEHMQSQQAIDSFQKIVPFVLKILLLEWRLGVEGMLAETNSLVSGGSQGDESIGQVEPSLDSILRQGTFCISCFKLFLKMYKKELVNLEESQIALSSSPGGPSASKKCIRMWIGQLLQYISLFEKYRQGVEALSEVYTKMMLLSIRMISHMLAREPLGFRHHLNDSLCSFFKFLGSDDRVRDGVVDFEKFTLKALTFMHEVINTYEYRESYKEEDPDNAWKVDEASAQCGSFFTPQAIGAILKILVFRLMLLTEEDLHLWENEPENLVHVELNGWQERARPSAEILFSTMLRKWPEVCGQVVLDMLQSSLDNDCAQDPGSGVPLPQILLKDSIYSAVAHAGSEISERIDFGKFLGNQLTADLQVADPRYKIVRRRVAIIIEYWFCFAALPIPQGLLPSVLNTLVFLLRPEEDTAVRIWAAIALRNVIAHHDFEVAEFQPFAATVVNSLAHLVTLLTADFIHIQLLTVISVIVKKLGVHSIQITSILLQVLNSLWSFGTHGSDLLKTNILRCLRKIVKAQGKKFSQVDAMLPAINFSVSGESQDGDALTEDGLRLWSGTLMTMQHIQDDSDYLQLLPHLARILQNAGYDHARTIINILGEYVCKASDSFLTSAAVDIMQLISQIIMHVADSTSLHVFPIVHVLMLRLDLQSSPIQQFLRSLLERLFDSKESGMMRIQVLLVTGRYIILATEHSLASLLDNVDQLGAIMDLWTQAPLDTLPLFDIHLLGCATAYFVPPCIEHEKLQSLLPAVVKMGSMACARVGSASGKQNLTSEVDSNEVITSMVTFVEGGDPVSHVDLLALWEHVRGSCPPQAQSLFS